MSEKSFELISASFSGKKREKFISSDQMLIQFAEDKELQAALEAAKQEAEKQEAEKQVEEITYTRTKAI